VGGGRGGVRVQRIDEERAFHCAGGKETPGRPAVLRKKKRVDLTGGVVSQQGKEKRKRDITQKKLRGERGKKKVTSDFRKKGSSTWRRKKGRGEKHKSISRGVL